MHFTGNLYELVIYIKQVGMFSDWISCSSMYSKHLSNIQLLLLETYYKHQEYIV